MRSPVVERLGAQRPRWVRLPPGRVASSGDELADYAESYGLVLDDWQRWWLDHALSERADGDWCASDTVLITGRQSGKNGVLAALELGALVLLGDRKIVHSAHEMATALNHFEWLIELIDGSPELSKRFKPPVKTNGREALITMSGQRLVFRARLKNSGRGLSAPRIVFDEAFDIRPQAMGALIPTTRAMKNRQFTYASSAPKASSQVLHSLVRRGRDGTDPDDRFFYAEWGNPKGTRLDDEDAWAAANPALGIRVTLEALRDEFRTLVSGGDAELIAEFAREAVGIAEEPNEHGDPKLPEGKWEATATLTPKAGRELIATGSRVFAFDVDMDAEHAAICAGVGTVTDPFVECVAEGEGASWLPKRLVELVKKHNPTCVGYQTTGPAKVLVNDVVVAFRNAGLSTDLLHPLNSSEYQAACGSFYLNVVEKRLRRTSQEQGPLDIAAADATERELPEGWVWHRRQATVPISPLVAATVAAHLLPVEAEPALEFKMW